MGLIIRWNPLHLYTPLLGVNSSGKRGRPAIAVAVEFRFRYFPHLPRDILERRSKYGGFIQVTPHEQRYKRIMWEN
jgi:hypothetical protein